MNHKTTVLLIEDEKNICQFITTSLESAQYRVVSAMTGSEGLSLAASLCPDVVLLDLGLPDMDGLQVITTLRSWTMTPIIVISARIKEQEKVRALKPAQIYQAGKHERGQQHRVPDRRTVYQ